MRVCSLLRWLIIWAAVSYCAAQEAAPPCSSCHEQKVEGVHSALSCVKCHAGHEVYPHPSNVQKAACANCHEKIAQQDSQGVHGRALLQGKAAPDCSTCHGTAHKAMQPKSVAFRARIPETCGTCHSAVAAEFRASVHGRALEKGLSEVAVCTDCHGAHAIVSHTSASSPVNPSRIRETCGSCHADVRLSRRFGFPVDRLISFDASYHGLAAKAGSQTVANCASCHGVHNILPSSDARSTIHPSNLAATCGHCHSGAGQRFAMGPVHVREGQAEAAGVRWVRTFYVIAIPAVIGWMLLHNLSDWVRKLRRLRFGNPEAVSIAGYLSVEPRMLPFERLQHLILILSFTVLVWTGFALKYPDQWWARPLLVWESRWPVRSAIHRAAGVSFIVVAVMHAVSLAVSPRLRSHWRLLLPHWGDLADALRHTAYSLGLAKPAPGRPSHSYVEKFEYWAVVWGAAVMILTGWMLWANNLMLAWLPKWALDVATAIHFYEAVLATLAIVVWHLYFVLFDPDVYPMDPAWLTGKSVRKREQP